ncbi:MAG: hypothetical protein HUJ30_01830, partial [Gammaproteobacteria bacterium]|nr:hypothetical protein [Gammaproteobacteria bacterium]
MFNRSIVKSSQLIALINLALLLTTPLLSQELSHAKGPLKQPLSAHDQSALSAAEPIDRQLAKYARQVPEMGFLRLYGDKAANILSQLPELLGDGAMNMDYEHNTSVRNTLMELQMYRIGLMLDKDLPSATLFKVGDDSVFEHKYLCVITLDLTPYKQTPSYATQFMLSGYNDSVLIENDAFLKFTVDHEVFHCLDAYFNGPPIKKTQSQVVNHYQQYINEARADAFSTLTFKQNVKNPNHFLNIFAAMRTLSVLNLDLQHFTGDVIRHSINTFQDFGIQSIETLIDMSRELVNDIIPSYEVYGIRLASTIQMLKQRDDKYGTHL